MQDHGVLVGAKIWPEKTNLGTRAGNMLGNQIMGGERYASRTSNNRNSKISSVQVLNWKYFRLNSETEIENTFSKHTLR